VEYVVDCTAAAGEIEQSDLARTGREEQEFNLDELAPSAHYDIVASLLYRKADQFLINFLLGEDSGLSAPVIEMTSTRARVMVAEAGAAEVDTAEAAGL
jgi:phosphohistidine phosphatase SixA